MMHGRDFAAIFRRGLVAVLASSLALLLAPPAGAAASTTTILAVRMFQPETGEDFLVARGGSEESDPFSTYAMTARLSRLPCPGDYVLQMSTENQDSGASSLYRASIGLTPWAASPDPPRCDEQVPSRPGTVEILIAGPHEPFWLEGERKSSGGGFFGEVILNSAPGCGGGFVFKAKVAAKGWRRTVNYRMAFEDVRYEAQGLGIPLCPE